MLRRMFYGLLLLLILLGAGGYFALVKAGNLAADGTAAVVSRILEAPVEVDELRIRPALNGIRIEGVVIGNPEGFNTRSAVQVDRVQADVSLRSLFSEEPEIELIRFVEPKVTLEQGLRASNLSTLIANARRAQTGGGGGSDPKGDPKEKETGKRIIIRRLILDEGTLALSTPALMGQEASVRLPRIEMTDVGRKDKPGPAEAAAILEQVLREVLLESSKAAGEESADELKAALAKSVEEMSQTLKDEAGKLGIDTKAVRDGIGRAAEGLKNRLGKD